MVNHPFPTAEVVRQLINADYEQGRLFWRVRGIEWFRGKNEAYREGFCRKWNRENAGKECFLHSSRGYRIGGILGYSQKAHRVLWAHKYGEWPNLDVDHINRIKHDNRLENLRLANGVQNQANIAGKFGTSIYKGVCFHSRNQRWIASIRICGKRTHLGYYDDEKSAAEAYDAAALRLYGEFAYLNRPA